MLLERKQCYVQALQITSHLYIDENSKVGIAGKK